MATATPWGDVVVTCDGESRKPLFKTDKNCRVCGGFWLVQHRQKALQKLRGLPNSPVKNITALLCSEEFRAVTSVDVGGRRIIHWPPAQIRAQPARAGMMCCTLLCFQDSCI